MPLLSAAGALRLNSGHSGLVADLAIAAGYRRLIATFLLAPWCDDALLVVILFAAALAMMWSYSLRGNLVYGFDISNEYYSLSQTVTSGVWHVSHPNDAYGAMLSLTILPAELHAMSGISGAADLQVRLPGDRRALPGRGVQPGPPAARRAVGVHGGRSSSIMQQTFFQQLPALARQEVATLLFAALMRGGTRHRPAAAHPVDLRVPAEPGDGGVPLLHRLPGDSAAGDRGGAPVGHLVVQAGAPDHGGGAARLRRVRRGAAVWYGSLTHSTSNMSQFVAAGEGQGLNLLPNSAAPTCLHLPAGRVELEMYAPAQYQNYISRYLQGQRPVHQAAARRGPRRSTRSSPPADPTPPVTLAARRQRF